MSSNNIGIGVNNPQEKLQIDGGILLGAAVNANNGTICFNGSDILGRKGDAWISLTTMGLKGDKGDAGARGPTGFQGGDSNWPKNDDGRLYYMLDVGIGVTGTTSDGKLYVKADAVDSLALKVFGKSSLDGDLTITGTLKKSGVNGGNDLLAQIDTNKSGVATNTSGVATNVSGLADKANLAAPTFTGIPKADTATSGTNTTQLATTAFVSTAVSDLVSSAPETLNTLNELAAALGDDNNYATTTTTALGNRYTKTQADAITDLLAPKDTPTFTGTSTFEGTIKGGSMFYHEVNDNSYDMVRKFIQPGGIRVQDGWKDSLSAYRISVSSDGTGYDLVVKDNGNVGVSNSSPSYTLDVDGDINFTGDLRSGGSILNTGASVDAFDNFIVGTGTAAPSDTSGSTNGRNNIMLGENAGSNMTTGRKNVCIGKYAGTAITEATSCVCIGTEAGYRITTGKENICIGLFTGNKITTGTNHVMMGYGCGRSITTANFNIGIGNYCCGYDTVGGILTTGNYNTFMGFSAGRLLTTGTYNVGMGYKAMRNVSTGDNNVCLGQLAGACITTANYMVCIGYKAGESITTADYPNTCIGKYAGQSIVTGRYNVCIGTEAGRSMATGEDNVCIGYRSGYNTTTSYNNTFIGYEAGIQTTTAGNNICIGMRSGSQIGSNNRHCYIGSNEGNRSISYFWCNSALSTGSDRRIKTDIEDVESNFGLAFIKKLRPVNYKMKNSYDLPDEIRDNDLYNDKMEEREKVDMDGNPILDDEGNPVMEEYLKKGEPRPEDPTQIRVGLIAQEVHQVIKELGLDHDKLETVCKDPENETETASISYTGFIMPLINAVKELSQENDDLKAEIAAIKAHLGL